MTSLTKARPLKSMCGRTMDNGVDEVKLAECWTARRHGPTLQDGQQQGQPRRSTELSAGDPVCLADTLPTTAEDTGSFSRVCHVLDREIRFNTIKRTKVIPDVLSGPEE